METGDFITTAQVAALSGCARTTVHWWSATGKLSSIRVGVDRGEFGGQERLFRRADVIRFLAQRAAKRQQASLRRLKKK